MQLARILAEQRWIWIFCLVAVAACSACGFHSNSALKALSLERQLVQRTPIQPESLLYEHFFSIRHDLQRQAFFSLSPMYQCIVVRDALMHRNRRYPEYMQWFSSNDQDVIEETCSLMLLADFSNETFCLVYGYLVANDLLDNFFHDNRHEYVAASLLAMFSLFSSLDAKQIDKLFSTFASLSDQRTLLSLFEHMTYIQVVTRTITEDPFLVHQRVYLALIHDLYGVSINNSEECRAN